MQNSKLPVLAVFKGLPGTGKSTLARELHKEIGWPLIDRDAIKEQLIYSGVSEKEIGFKSHQIMWEKAESFLQEGTSAICDTNLNQKVILEDVKRIEEKKHAQILIVECLCEDKEVQKSRIDARKDKGLLSFWVDSWEKCLQYENSDKTQAFEISYPKIQVDTGNITIQEGVEKISRFILSQKER
jgi:predicted kinase